MQGKKTAAGPVRAHNMMTGESGGFRRLPPKNYRSLWQPVAMQGGSLVAITKETTIIEALQSHPQAREVFVRHGLGCIGCMGAAMESIGSGARLHGVDPEVVVRELNQLLEPQK
jgi:hybrid cluster-associated redox disulfide protein